MHLLAFDELLDWIYDYDDAIFTKFAALGCITGPQWKYLVNIPQQRDRNDKLLELLTRRSIADFQNFITVLAKEQPYLMKLLVTDEGEASLIRRLFVNYYFKKS